MSGLDIDSFGRRTLQRRRRLARLLAAGPAPTLVRAYDLDRGGRLVAEYVPRVTLEDLLAVAPLPAAAALDALRDVAEELRGIATERGEAHGDVKPWNVVVLPDGHATIVDPKLAGEAVTGATRRGDAYWFAVLACEVLTGTRPIDRQDADCLMERAGLPADARAAVLRGLAAHPQRRPFPHTLVAALARVPDEAWPGGRREPSAVEPVAVEALVTEPAPELAPVAAEPAPEAPPEPEAAQEAEVVDPAPSAGADPEAAVVVRPPGRPRRSLLRRLGPYVVTLGVALVLAGVAGGAWLLRLDAQAGDGPGPVRAQEVALRITPPHTTCPLARVHLSATIVTNGRPGTLTVRWSLPGGTRVPVRTVSVPEGQRTATVTMDVSVTGDQRLRGPAVAVVRPGGARASTPFVFACASGGAGRSGHNG
ncbi:MAG TPA: hypothetical protein VD859_14025 [Nocardioides sp.]|nr:hypothetical protein [Nocardioides sp.]